MEEARKLENAEEVFEVTISYKEEGRKEGREEGKKEVALKMLKDGFEIEKVIKLTGLDKKEIEELEKQL